MAEFRGFFVQHPARILALGPPMAMIAEAAPPPFSNQNNYEFIRSIP